RTSARSTTSWPAAGPSAYRGRRTCGACRGRHRWSRPAHFGRRRRRSRARAGDSHAAAAAAQPAGRGDSRRGRRRAGAACARGAGGGARHVAGDGRAAVDGPARRPRAAGERGAGEAAGLRDARTRRGAGCGGPALRGGPVLRSARVARAALDGGERRAYESRADRQGGGGTGASRGIGRAIALGMAGEGARVVAVARDKAALDTLATEARARSKRDAVAIGADLSRLAEVERVVDEA